MVLMVVGLVLALIGYFMHVRGLLIAGLVVAVVGLVLWFLAGVYAYGY